MNQKIISWRNQKALKEITELLLKDILTDSLIGHLRMNCPKYIVSDDSSWLRDAIQEVHSRFIEDPFNYFVQRIRDNIKFVRAYHGCKPIDLTPYFKNGIIPLNMKEFISSTMRLLKEFDVTQNMVQEAIGEIRTECREGYAWFVLDDRLFFEGAGHYLIYGSELLQAVSGHIQRNHFKPTRSYLDKIGVPTILVCNVPVEMIDSDTLRGLAGTILEAYFEFELKEIPYTQGLNFGFSIAEKLNPEFIKDHYHPKEIENPLLGRMIYRVPITRCEYCN